MVDTLHGLQASSIHPRPQDNSQATLAPILKKEDGLVDFSRSAAEIFNRIRGFQPWPGAYTKFRGKTLQIIKARPTPDAVTQAELRAAADRVLAGCGHNTSLELLELQLEGKKRSSARDFLHGYRPQPNEKLG
jgi:methionyl-tRNA formyltransferase